MTLVPFSTATCSVQSTRPLDSGNHRSAIGVTATEPQRSDAQDLSVTERELFATHQATLPRVVKILAPTVFGLGLAAMIIALVFQPAGLLRPLLWGFLMIAAGVGMFRTPRYMTTQAMTRLGVDGTLSYRLSITPEFLTIEDRTGQRMIKWNEIDAALSAEGHFTLLRARKALFVPILTGVENQLFIEILKAHVSGNRIEVIRHDVRGSLMITAFQVFLSLVFAALALFLVGRLDAARSTSNSDRIVCPQGEALQNDPSRSASGNCPQG